jgi:hypothetical protein
MVAWVVKIVAYAKRLFERCLTEPGVNSRVIFLLTAIVSCLIMLVHTAIYALAFLRYGRMDPSYPTILGILCGGHGVNAIGRFFTKKNGNSDNGHKANGVDNPDAPRSPANPS